VTASAGVATLPDHARRSAALVEAADAALYQAKQAGRDRAVHATATTAAARATATETVADDRAPAPRLADLVAEDCTTRAGRPGTDRRPRRHHGGR
jgi:hypothetical protein